MPIKSYTVVQADHKKDFESKRDGRTMSVYSLLLTEEGDASGTSYPCEVTQLQKTEPPAAGQKLEGTIEAATNPDWPDKFKKHWDGGKRSSGGGGSYKPRDPSEIAGARHAHNLLVAAHSFTPLTQAEAENPTDVQGRIDDLEAFACVLDEKTETISNAARTGGKEKTKDDDVPF